LKKFKMKELIKRKIRLFLIRCNLDVLIVTPRPMINFIKETKKDNLRGVEIGTECGENAFRILKALPIKKLYLIDPYLEYGESKETFERTQNFLNKDERIAKKRLRRFGDKIVFIKKTSEKAIEDIPNNLDFVYIDGNHDYEFVKKDIELYYSKVKIGGVFGGHDFYRNGNKEGVARAVLERFNIKDLYFDDIDWWIIKR